MTVKNRNTGLLSPKDIKTFYLRFRILPITYMALAPTYMTNRRWNVPNVFDHSPTSEKWWKAWSASAGVR